MTHICVTRPQWVNPITHPAKYWMKLQQSYHWSLGMDKPFHSTLYDGQTYLSLLGLKLIHVSKGGPRQQKHFKSHAGTTHWWSYNADCFYKCKMFLQANFKWKQNKNWINISYTLLSEKRRIQPCYNIAFRVYQLVAIAWTANLVPYHSINITVT